MNINQIPLRKRLFGAAMLGFTSIALAGASKVNAGSNGPDSSQFTPEKLDGVISKQGTQLNFSDNFGFTSLSQAVNTIISVVFFGAALAAFVFIVIGAFQYVTAGDDAAKTDKSRKTITNAVVGLILVALVYVIFQIVIRIVPGLSDWFGLAS